METCTTLIAHTYLSTHLVQFGSLSLVLLGTLATYRYFFHRPICMRSLIHVTCVLLDCIVRKVEAATDTTSFTNVFGRGRRGRVGFTWLHVASRGFTWLHVASHRCIPDSVLGLGRDRICVKLSSVLLAVGRWFPPGTPVSSTSQTDISSSPTSVVL